MKRAQMVKWSILITLILGSILPSNAQSDGVKPSIAVVDFDVRGYKLNSAQVIQFTMNELMRVDQHEVMDRYDIEYLSKRDSLSLGGCFSKICLSDIGKRLKVDAMLTGSISQLGDNINITIRVLDVKTGIFTAGVIKEFLVIPGSELQMIRICMNELFKLPNDLETVKKLTLRSDFDNTVNNPYTLRLRSDGPRMGMTYATGFLGDVLQKEENVGGYGGQPYMFQFGYQFEKQYLNEGDFQALFEFLPMITGLDQGRFIPSVTLLNGIRNNTNGWEFAFGPTFAMGKFAEGYIASNDEFVIRAKNTSISLEQEAQDAGKSLEKRPDSRGNTEISYGFLFAAGKTIKSGKLNIPLNVFVVPGRNGLRFGLSMGWNGKSRYENTLN